MKLSYAPRLYPYLTHAHQVPTTAYYLLKVQVDFHVA